MAFPYIHSTSNVQISGSRFGFQLWCEDKDEPVFRGKIQARSGLNWQHLEFTCALHREISSVTWGKWSETCDISIVCVVSPSRVSIVCTYGPRVQLGHSPGFRPRFFDFSVLFRGLVV